MRIHRFSTFFTLPASKAGFLVVAACAALAGIATTVKTAEAAPASMLRARDDFDTRSMLRPGPGTGQNGTTSSASSFSLGQPSRFSMHQSYSLSAMSGPNGSMSSGLYLNTVTYRISPPLSLSADVGFHTPIHSSVPGLEQGGGAGSIVFPRLGLEYRPTDRLTMNLELFNGPDAWKAYGGMPWSSRLFQGSRTP